MANVKMRRLIAILFTFSIFHFPFAMLSGCRVNDKPPTRRGYYGSTETMSQVVAAINKNNQQIPTLWATHDFEATIIDEDKKSHFVNGDGVLLYTAPKQMRLVGKKEIGRVFEIGSDAENYWLTVVPSVDTMWWGRYANLGKPCNQTVAIRPDLILEVLGISTFPSDFTSAPVPTMRFNNDADAYMFVWNAPLPDRWIAQKEIWYDRQTKRPRLVVLFDANGRIVLRAYLTNFRRVPVEGAAESDRPWIATTYRLLFPETGSKMSFDLNDVQLQHEGAPNDRSFRLPINNPGVEQVIQLDKDCND